MAAFDVVKITGGFSATLPTRSASFVSSVFTSIVYVNVPVPIPTPIAVTAPLVQYVPEFDESTSSTDYGTDVRVFPDVDPTLALTSSKSIIVDALARRLLTPSGSLPFHPDYGLDLRQWLNEGMTQDKIFQIKASVQSELLKDERVASVNALVTFDFATSTLTLQVEVESAVGPFKFTLGVSAVTIDLLVSE